MIKVASALYYVEYIHCTHTAKDISAAQDRINTLIKAAKLVKVHTFATDKHILFEVCRIREKGE